MHIKIYFDDRPLFLTDSLTVELLPFLHHVDAVYMDELSTPAVNSIIHEMRQPKVHAGIFFHEPLKELEHAFRKKFQVVLAAGGIISNDKEEIMIIYRRGKWDLPKGKLDPGETLEQCAVREAEEETGLKNIRMQSPLLVTWHVYDESGKHILKETHWYRLSVSGHQQARPQAEEQITAIEWASRAEVKKYISNTYPSIIDVLRKGGYIP